MKRIVITNNKKVVEKLNDKAQIEYKEISALEVLKEGKYTAQQGGRLLIDPTRVAAKSYYRSLPFVMGEDEPHQQSIELIDQCIAAIGDDKRAFAKEPFLAGIAQNKDADIINKVIG